MLAGSLRAEGLASEVLSFRSPTVCRTPRCRRHRDSSERARCRTETRHRGEVDFERAADLYTQGWSLRQIGAELAISSTTVNEQLRRAGVAMRRGAPAHPASTQQILELRDQGLTWPEIAEQVGMTVSGACSTALIPRTCAAVSAASVGSTSAFGWPGSRKARPTDDRGCWHRRHASRSSQGKGERRSSHGTHSASALLRASGR